MEATAGEIRHDIEQARARVGAAVGAIGHRTDTPARLRHGFSHLAHDIGGAFTKQLDGSSASDTAMGSDTSSSRAGNTAVNTWSTVRSFAKANALALGLGAFAVGVIAGMFVPRSKLEGRKITPFASEIKHRAVETGERAIQKGRQIARSAWAA